MITFGRDASQTVLLSPLPSSPAGLTRGQMAAVFDSAVVIAGVLCILPSVIGGITAASAVGDVPLPSLIAGITAPSSIPVIPVGSLTPGGLTLSSQVSCD